MKTFRSLRHRDYRLYFFGQMVSLTGSWMQTTALMWLAWDMTHEAKWPAFIMVSIVGPTLLFGAWGGALADRLPKRRVILCTQFCFFTSALILTSCVLSGIVTRWLLLGLMLLHGSIQAIDLPTRLAWVPDLVPREDLVNAVALNSLLFNVARTIGPALAGIALAYAGPATCFLINAFSYLAVIVALSLMSRGAGDTVVDGVRDTTGGFRIVRRDAVLRTTMVLAGLVAIAGWPTLSLLPAYAERVLGQDQKGFSLLMSCLGGGALLGAATTATFGRESRQNLLMLVGVGCVCTMLAGLSQVGHFYWACAEAVVFGFGMILFFSTGQAIVQMQARPTQRGKVMGIWAMIMSGGTPLGNVVFGPLADVVGVDRVLLVQAGLMSIVVVALATMRVRLRRRTRSLPLEVGPTTPIT